MECLILHNEEISEEECRCVTMEAYKDRNGAELPKRFKRVIGWKMICKECKNHHQ